MRLYNHFFCCLFLYMHTTYAVEYTYPVGSIDNGENILYIHQHTIDNLELFEWNTKKNHTEPILWSMFNPAGLQLLPNNIGFSFIDNGRLRIKSFLKRSPKAIDFDEPLFNISTLTWIDEHTCYCSAQQDRNFGLFELDDDGTVRCLLKQSDHDYMYPQKIATQLFYIERYQTKGAVNSQHYKIISTSYQNNNVRALEPKLIADFENSPIVFLTMLSDQEGFVMEHPQNIDSDSSTILFTYHHIIKQGKAWSKNPLFSFEIPSNLLLNEDQRLYESLLPLLPRIAKNRVYYVDCAQHDNLQLEPYYYDMETKLTQKIAVPAKEQGHYFVPILYGQKLYCGGTALDGQKEPLISFLT